MVNSIISQVYIVPGLPHILLAHDKSPYWQSLYESYGRVREEIKNIDADLILYFSTQWLSVIGYLFQADPAPEWVHVDQNWYEYGSMPYKFKVDSDFDFAYADEVKKLGHNVKAINYYGFPIDTGTIVAQKLINPDNRLPASMVSCNMYSEKDESLSIGAAAANALKNQEKKAIVVLVSTLSNRYEIKEIEPKNDKISSAKDHEWNLKILELLGEGRLEDVSQCTREFSRQANADMQGKGIWWLNGICGQNNNFQGKVFDYQPVWGTGCAIVGLTPVEQNEYEIKDNKENEEVQPSHLLKKDEKVGLINSSRAPEPVGA